MFYFFSILYGIETDVETVFLCVEIVGRKSKYFLDLLSSDELSDVSIVGGPVSYPEWGNCINDLNIVFFIYLCTIEFNVTSW